MPSGLGIMMSLLGREIAELEYGLPDVYAKQA